VAELYSLIARVSGVNDTASASATAAAASAATAELIAGSGIVSLERTSGTGRREQRIPTQSPLRAAKRLRLIFITGPTERKGRMGTTAKVLNTTGTARVSASDRKEKVLIHMRLKGDKGDTGDTGPKGDTGDMGPTGAAGVDGEAGGAGGRRRRRTVSIRGCASGGYAGTQSDFYSDWARCRE
jgi:hypothetical protein